MARYGWEDWPDEKLLETRLCDLGLKMHGSRVEPFCRRLLREIAGRHLKIKPHFWISTEFFVPDGYTGIAVPFYLLHPRLTSLERKMTGEAEGEKPRQLMQLLRHEFGHVFDNAYRCRSRKQRQRLFGSSKAPYRNYYESTPYSRKFVRHLAQDYAQSHPDEDFAETVAVCLTPRSGWRKKYAGWPALRKLEYIDGLLKEFRDRKPPKHTREEVDSIGSCRLTLRKYYEKKLKYLRQAEKKPLDRKLKRMFTADEASVGRASRRNAGRFVRQIKKTALREVSQRTGIFQYKVDQVLKDVLTRCREKRFSLIGVERQKLRKEFLGLLENESRRYERRGLYRKMR